MDPLPALPATIARRTPLRVCFVCLGNICRSPTAEGALRHLLHERGLEGRVAVDSAGTSAVHAGEPPDARSTAAARAQGILLAGAARRFEPEDFDRFDVVLAMDRSNLRALQRLPGADRFGGVLRLFRDFDPESPPDSDTPDPYYGGPQGFAEVVALCRRGAAGLLDAVAAGEAG